MCTMSAFSAVGINPLAASKSPGMGLLWSLPMLGYSVVSLTSWRAFADIQAFKSLKMGVPGCV